MQFHSYVHGSNIGLSKNGTVAIRNSSDTNFCDAIAFSSKPISFNRSFTLKIKSAARKWRGCLSLGLTTRDPTSFINSHSYPHSNNPNKTPINQQPAHQKPQILLPQFASLISLASQEKYSSNFWLRELPIEWSNANLTFILTHNLNHTELVIVFNNEHQITFLHYLPVDSSFWLILDLFGQTNYIEILEPIQDQGHLNEAHSCFYERIPNAVLLNGPNFIQQYKQSCAHGSLHFNSGRIFLIGPSCSGKSLLKRVLLSANTEQANEEHRNGSLDTSYKCYSNGKGHWSNENPKLGPEVDVLSKEEQYENLAYNFAKMILMQQQKSKQNQGEALNDTSDVEKSKLFNDTVHNISSIFKNALKFSMKNSKAMIENNFDNIGSHNSEMETDVNEIVFPDKIKEQLNSMLTKKEEILKEEFPESNQSQLVNSFMYRIFDFSGNFVYFLLNQAVLSSHAIYLLVIDISNDLETPLNQLRSSSIQVETKKCDVNTINVINFWLSVIYSHVGNPSVSFSKKKDVEEVRETGSSHDRDSPRAPNSFLTTNAKITTPKVIIVATHRNSLHSEPITRNQLIEETFEKIRKNLQTKPYGRLVHPEFFAVDCKQMSFDELRILDKLRLLIDNEFIHQNLVNNCIPFAWLEFEQLINKLTKRGINFIDYTQLGELIKTQIEDEAYFSANNFNANLQMLVNFYHLQGKLFSFNTAYQGYSNETLIVLNPVWFMNCFYKICDFVLQVNKENENLLVSGVLKEELLNNVWSEQLDQKLVLVGCLEKLDMICELRPCLSIDESPDSLGNSHLQSQIQSQLQNQVKSYIFPWITQILPEAINKTGLFYDVRPLNSLKLHVMFNVFMPIGLFSRLVVRLCRWSWTQGYGRKPEICHSEARIAVDFDHDLILKIILKKRRIDLLVVKMFSNIQSDFHDGSLPSNNPGPSPNVCVKVRHLVESDMEFIQSVYYRRISWILKVICPCDLRCTEHDTLNCQLEDCLHFLPLDECLNKKFVECDYRQIRTTFVSQYFPAAYSNVQYTSNGSVMLYNNQNENAADCSGQSNGSNGGSNFYELIQGWDHHSIFQIEPGWLRDAAKQLQKKNDSNHDWIALSKRLGYLTRDIKRFRSEEEQSPALALLRDWFESNGRTRYCIDILTSCLHIIDRDDVKAIIESEVKPERCSPPIFLSYQWQSQDQVLELRRKLELAGFPCFMDISGIGGGDELYGKIYEGISNCKVVICCLTPKYSASRSCCREVTLADVLHKPILPILMEPTPWPPAGPIALIMSSLVYIDLCGVGGHGGIGRRGDNATRFREILDRITRYIAGYVDIPLFNRNYILPDLFQPQQNQESILIMAANSQANGLSVLEEIDRDGVELRLVNNVNGNGAAALNRQQSSNPSTISALNDSTDDLVSLPGDQLTENASSSRDHSITGQLLSTNGLENLVSTSTGSSSDGRRLSQGRLTNNGHHLASQQTISSILESSANDNQGENGQVTARVVEIYSLNEFDRRSLNRALSSANSASNQVSNCSICNII